jgi:hypothetical protein
MSKGQGQSSALVLIVALALLSGCATSKPEMAWVRTDGRKVLDDPALLKKGETDIALCNANLDSGAVDEGARKCMGLKGYALVRKNEAEDARAGFAAAQRVSTPSAGGGSKEPPRGSVRSHYLKTALVSWFDKRSRGKCRTRHKPP